MPTASVTNTFAPLTLIESAEVNTNFQDLVTFLNGQVIQKDASVAFTAVPSGPASDPVSDNQFTRKRYVDRRTQAGSVAMNFVAQTTFVLSNVPFTFAYSAAPIVVCAVTGGGTTPQYGVRTNEVNTANFDVAVEAVDGTAYTGVLNLHWIAVGTPA